MTGLYRCAVVATAAVAALGWSIAAGAQRTVMKDGVDSPFASPAAIAALKEDLLQNGGPDALASLPANADEVLPHIKWWGYSIHEDATGSGKAMFIQRFDASAVTAQLRQWVSGMRKGGCSFVNPSAPSFTVLPKQVNYSALLSGKKRACGSILGEDWATDIATVSGSVSGSLPFRVVPSDAVPDYKGKVELDQPSISIDVEANEILGINVNSVVGDLLKGIVQVAGSPFGAAIAPGVGVPAWAISSEMDKAMRDVRGRASEAAFYLDRVRGEVDTDKYNRTLATSQTVVWGFQPDWTMDDAETKFVGEASDLALEIVFRAAIPRNGQVELAAEGAVETLRRLRSYAASQKTVLAGRGQSWTSLSKEHYRTEFLAEPLRMSQPQDLRNRQVRRGQQVVVPPMWKVSIIPGHYVVRPGDTFEGVCKRREPGQVSDCVRRLRRLNPRVAPQKLPALSVIALLPDTETPLQSPPSPPPLN